MTTARLGLRSDRQALITNEQPQTSSLIYMVKKKNYRPKRARLVSSLRNFVNSQPNSKNSTDFERSRRDLSRCKVTKKKKVFFTHFCWLETRPSQQGQFKTQKNYVFIFCFKKKVRELSMRAAQIRRVFSILAKY